MKKRIFITIIIQLILINSAYSSNVNNSTNDIIKECMEKEIFYEKANCISNKLIMADDEKVKTDLFKLLINYWIDRDGGMGYSL